MTQRRYMPLNGQLTDAMKGEDATISGSWDFTSDVDLTSGADLRIYDSGNTDYLQLYHDGADAHIRTTNATWLRLNSGNDSGFSGTLNLYGMQERWYDSDNTDSVRIRHDGTWGILDHGNQVGGIGTRVVGTALSDRYGLTIIPLSAADEATTSVSLPHAGGFYFLVPSNSSIAQVNDCTIGYWQSTTSHGAVFDVNSSNISRGTGSNPDTAGDLNIWFTTSGTTMNIKNRRGSIRYMNLIIIGGDS